jgi:HAD superfamily hydrolase (TIGR01509 family)
MPSAKYQAILFDFDGVLVDSEPIHHRCWQEVLAPYGIELPWQLYADNCIGIVDRAMLSFLCNLATPPLEIETLQPEYPRKKELFRSRMTAIGIAEDVKALLTELRPNYKLAVVSSSNIREIQPVLDASGLSDMFDTIVHGGNIPRHKPFPDPYLRALERLNTTSALAIEDSKAGIASARAAGLPVLEIPAATDLCRLLRAAL